MVSNDIKKKFSLFAKKTGNIKKIANSLAPDIFGMTRVKLSLLL